MINTDDLEFLLKRKNITSVKELMIIIDRGIYNIAYICPYAKITHVCREYGNICNRNCGYTDGHDHCTRQGSNTRIFCTINKTECTNEHKYECPILPELKRLLSRTKKYKKNNEINLYKISLYVTAHSGMNLEEIKDNINSSLNNIHTNNIFFFNEKETTIVWDDNLTINKLNATKKNYDKFFDDLS